MKAEETKLIGKFNNFNILLKEGFFSNDKELTLRGNMSYSISISDSPHGNMVKLENILKGFEKEVEKSKKTIDEINRNLKQSKEELKKTFIHKEKFSMLLKRQLELNSELDMNKGNYLVVDEEEEVEVDEENKIKEMGEYLQI